MPPLLSGIADLAHRAEIEMEHTALK